MPFLYERQAAARLLFLLESAQPATSRPAGQTYKGRGSCRSKRNPSYQNQEAASRSQNSNAPCSPHRVRRGRRRRLRARRGHRPVPAPSCVLALCAPCRGMTALSAGLWRRWSTCARAYMTAGRVQADAAQGHLLLPAVPSPGGGPPRGKAAGPLGACGGGPRDFLAVSGDSLLQAQGRRGGAWRATGAQRLDAAPA